MKSFNTLAWRGTALAVGFALVSVSTGCQVNMGGQTLPSPWYHTDDVQYMAPGPEFKLTREAAAMKAYKADEAARR
jgi:hypothetical protein